MFPARQWGLVGVVTGGADGYATTKELTGNMYLLKSYTGDWTCYSRRSLERRRAVTQDSCGSTGLLWQRIDGSRLGCICTQGLPLEGSGDGGLYALAWHN
ncbi:hypothetical protein [Novipirellula artificiosorum]|uniref:Uncharacterized protein n=1 Tax=Novipirellula artificiosorum TaxID=2528016 RepID=A0A5C6DJ24_9BACT|nr:hypothetical protein [Novipirellula artificiosorum]TWU34899.1 hypothetical protein Poly41_40420 [Novipirellula artificiosorum]